ncbi:unnamed protein product [Phyllotreta striolata]|uniref:Uncharacterized protein n=1 Tax=Phyllotreta striolata TaxID=444603 RepID=A0A9N9THR2_PHYSR|nr:unnamed protein product [Phyllotreta striolata]
MFYYTGPVDMMDIRDQIGFMILLGLIIFLVLLIRKFIKVKQEQFKRQMQRREEEESHQNDDIFNISSRVTQNQDHPWPPHDAHISIDHFNIMDHMNKPMYDDAPPSYDEVMKTLEQAQSGGEGSTPIQVVVEAPKATATPDVATPPLS